MADVRDKNNLIYSDAKIVTLAKEINKVLAKYTKIPNWNERNDVKAQFEVDLTVLLNKNGYPDELSDEVIARTIESATNLDNAEKSAKNSQTGDGGTKTTTRNTTQKAPSTLEECKNFEDVKNY